MKKTIKRLFIKLDKEFHFLTSNQRTILFDHLPKCGGTTINSYLVNHYPNRFIFRISGINPHKSIQEFRDLSKKRRWKMKLIFGHAAHDLYGFTHPNTIAITVFREPIDRIISHYYYVKRTKSHYLHDIVQRDNIQLADYCSLNLSKELSNWYVTHFTGFSMQEVENKPDESVELALKNILKIYDLIGFQENISAFVNILKEEFSLKVPQVIAQKNKTQNRLQTEDLNQEIFDNISKNNAYDIQLYSKLLALRKNNLITGTKINVASYKT